MEELTLHLTGDIHAISAANNATYVLSFGHCWLTECQTRGSIVSCTDGMRRQSSERAGYCALWVHFKDWRNTQNNRSVARRVHGQPSIGLHPSPPPPPHHHPTTPLFLCAIPSRR
jgi:hypothetical protein